MNKRPPTSTSLKELLGVVCFVALCIASVRFSLPIVTLTVVAGCTVVIRMAIRSAVATGEPRAIATGFLIPVVIYAGTVLCLGNSELRPESQFQTVLPTSRIFATFRAEQPLVGLSGSRPRNVIDPELAPAQMLMWHTLFALLCGYCGGQYARRLYVLERASTAAE